MYWFDYNVGVFFFLTFRPKVSFQSSNTLRDGFWWTYCPVGVQNVNLSFIYFFFFYTFKIWKNRKKQKNTIANGFSPAQFISTSEKRCNFRVYFGLMRLVKMHEKIDPSYDLKSYRTVIEKIDRYVVICP